MFGIFSLGSTLFTYIYIRETMNLTDKEKKMLFDESEKPIATDEDGVSWHELMMLAEARGHLLDTPISERDHEERANPLLRVCP